MRITKARGILISIFLVGLLMQALAFLYIFANNAMKGPTLQKLLLKLLSVYSVPFAIITAGIFSDRTSNRSAPLLAFRVAVVLSVIWNLFLAWRSVRFGIAAEDSPQEVIDYLDAVSSASGFLVAGALAYFFSKGTTQSG